MTLPTDPSSRAALAALLDRYGADPAAWPERERAAALALAERDPDAARRIGAARRLDARLRESLAPAAVPPALRARLLAIPRTDAGRRAAAPAGGWRWRGAGRPAAVAIGLAASLLLGGVLGLATAPPPAVGPGDLDLAALMYGRPIGPAARL